MPLRSHSTFVELLCGCLISPEGWVTRVIAAIAPSKHWTSYYKLLERGSLRTLRLARQLLALFIQVIAPDVLNFVLDDTLVPRHSTTAPGSEIRHDHSNKKNRPQYLLSQCWVTLGVSITGVSGTKLVLPILSRLVPSTGNRNKLHIALALVRGVASVTNIPTRVLFDSWFMRARLVLPLLARNIQVLGQARRDTALFDLPPPKSSGQRGRPRKYGDKLTPARVEALAFTEKRLMLYGKEQRVRWRSTVVLARFLQGARVHAVWCSFYDEQRNTWSKARLILATEAALNAEEIIRLYTLRWGIEPLFHHLKRWWGVANLWQQERTVLELWMQIRSMAWALVQMLHVVVEAAFPVGQVAPWRTRQPLTAGMVAQWLRMEFTGLAFAAGYDRKCRKFNLPEGRKDPRLQPQPS